MQIPAPVLGLHFGRPMLRTYDGYALELANYIPRNGALCSRLPFAKTSTPAALPVWLHSHVSGTTRSLVGVAKNGTVRRFLPTESALASLTTGITESVSANVNGLVVFTLYPTNAPRAYDGTTLTTPAFTLPAAGDWATLATTDMTGLCVFKGRVFYWSFKSDEMLYTALNATAGVVSAFATKNISETGGNIKMITTLTRDGGTGPDDLMCIILDTGEMLTYSGDDPSSASSFTIAGRFLIPPPISADAVTRLGGDSLILTEKGLIPIENFIRQGFGSTDVEWMKAINPELESWAKFATPANIRGVVKHCPRNGFLVCIIESTQLASGLFPSGVADCFVLDTTSRAWTRFALNETNGGQYSYRTSYTFGGYGSEQQTGTPTSGLTFRQSHDFRTCVEHDGSLYLSAVNLSNAFQVIKYGNTAASNSEGDFGSTTQPIELFCAQPFLVTGSDVTLTGFRQHFVLNLSQVLTHRTFGFMFDGSPTAVYVLDDATDFTANGGVQPTVNSRREDAVGSGFAFAPFHTAKAYITYIEGWDQAIRYEGMDVAVTPTQSIFSDSFEQQPA